MDDFSGINTNKPQLLKDMQVDETCLKLYASQNEQEIQSIFQSLVQSENGNKSCFGVISELKPMKGLIELRGPFLKAMKDARLFDANQDETLTLISKALQNKESDLLESLLPLLDASVLFQKACCWGAVDVAQWLLDKNDKDVLLACQNSIGRTPLHLAAICERKQIAKFLIENGANLEARDASGSTPLILAAYGKDLSLINLLIDFGANVSVLNHQGHTPCALIKKHFIALPPDISEKDKGLTAEVQSRKMLAHRFGLAGTTQLAGCEIRLEGLGQNSAAEHLWTAMRGYYGQLKDSLATQEKGGSWDLVLNALSETSRKAALDLDPSAIGAILDSTREALVTDVNDRDLNNYMEKLEAGESLGLPLTWLRHAVGLAIRGNRIAFSNKGAGSNGAPGIHLYTIGNPHALEECLSTLIKRNSPEFWNNEIISKLGLTDQLYIPQKLQSVGNCSVANRNGMEFALLYMHLEPLLNQEAALEIAKAIHKGRVRDTKATALTHYLQSHGVNHGFTPDYELLGQILGRVTGDATLDQQISALLSGWELAHHIPKTVDVSSVNERGDTPLHLATKGSHFHRVKQLIGLGANINAQNVQGLTALHCAIGAKWLEGTKLLLENRADIESVTQKGNTPLTSAVLMGATDIVMHLVGLGASVNTRSKDGKTPLDIAIEKKNASLVQFLSVHGAKSGKEVAA